jgi:hypothetical protein
MAAFVLGLNGFVLFTNSNGVYLGDPALDSERRAILGGNVTPFSAPIPSFAKCDLRRENNAI